MKFWELSENFKVLGATKKNLELAKVSAKPEFSVLVDKDRKPLYSFLGRCNAVIATKARYVYLKQHQNRKDEILNLEIIQVPIFLTGRELDGL